MPLWAVIRIHYPTVVRNKEGGLVCVGQAWEYSKVIGLMSIQFDDAGHVLSCGGQASLVLGQTLQRKGHDEAWVNMTDDEIKSLVSTLSNPKLIKILAPDTDVQNVLSEFEHQYEQQTAKAIGRLAKDQSLCLVRVPGSDNRGTAVCADVIHRASGSDVAQVVAEAYRLAPDHGPADIGMTNAGGVRVPLETDGSQDLILTQGTAYTLLPFPNELYTVMLSGLQIRNMLEEAVANWKDHAILMARIPMAAACDGT